MARRAEEGCGDVDGDGEAGGEAKREEGWSRGREARWGQVRADGRSIFVGVSVECEFRLCV